MCVSDEDLLRLWFAFEFSLCAHWQRGRNTNRRMKATRLMWKPLMLLARAGFLPLLAVRQQFRTRSLNSATPIQWGIEVRMQVVQLSDQCIGDAVIWLSTPLLQH